MTKCGQVVLKLFITIIMMIMLLQESKSEVGTILYSYQMTSRVLYTAYKAKRQYLLTLQVSLLALQSSIVHSTIDNTAQSRPLNSLEHFIHVFTTSMTHIRPGRNSNPVPLSFEPQLDGMRHGGQYYIVSLHLLENVF